MNHILTEMLARYQTESLTDRKNAVSVLSVHDPERRGSAGGGKNRQGR